MKGLELERRKSSERENLSQMYPSYGQMLGGPAGCPQSFVRCSRDDEVLYLIKNS